MSEFTERGLILMKKNIIRVLSLVLVAAMLIGCTACTQTILVRFVDADGKDLQFGAGEVTEAGNLIEGFDDGFDDADVVPDTPAPANNTPAPASQTPASDTPASDTPASDTPASQTPASDTPASDTPASDTPASQTPAQQPTSSKPSNKNEILDFYKAAVNRVKNDGAAGYTKKEWQVLENVNITGVSAVDNTIVKLAGNYMTTADQAQNQVCAKGSNEAKDRFPNFILTDYSKVKSATIQESSTAYKIVIVMQDEDTPHKGSSFIAQVTNSVLLWEDIDKELKNISAISEYNNIHVWYRSFTITAVTTKDGKFTSLQHVAPNVDIRIGHAKLIISIDNKSGKLVNYCTYTNFQY